MAGAMGAVKPGGSAVRPQTAVLRHHRRRGQAGIRLRQSHGLQRRGHHDQRRRRRCTAGWRQHRSDGHRQLPDG